MSKYEDDDLYDGMFDDDDEEDEEPCACGSEDNHCLDYAYAAASGYLTGLPPILHQRIHLARCEQEVIRKAREIFGDKDPKVEAKKREYERLEEVINGLHKLISQVKVVQDQLMLGDYETFIALIESEEDLPGCEGLSIGLMVAEHLPDEVQNIVSIFRCHMYTDNYGVEAVVH